MTQPASVFVDENLLVLWVVTIAVPSAPTVAELTAGSVLDATYYFTDGGWKPTIAEDTANDPRLAKRENFNRAGRRATTLPLIYVTNPATPAADAAAITFVEDAVGYFVERRGVDHDTAIAAAQKVNVYPVTLGAQIESDPTGNTPFTIAQTGYLRPPGRQLRVAVAA
jgi:hypothetical protein